MRAAVLVVLIAAAIVCSDGAVWVRRGHHNATDATLHLRAETNVTSYKPEILCKTCVDFMAANLNNLLNAILQVGIGGTCQKVCGLLPGTVEQEVCTGLCLIVGMEKFVNALSEDDLDPIWICVRLHSCPINTCTSGCTEIQAATVSPAVGPVRSKFYVSVTVKALKNSGTGSTLVLFPCVAPKCQQGFGFEVLNDELVSGQSYTSSFEIDTAEQSWLFTPATYPVQIQNCAYDCEDGQHGLIYSTGYTNFTITSGRF